MGCSTSNYLNIEKKLSDSNQSKQCKYYKYDGEFKLEIKEKDGPSEKIELDLILDDVENAKYSVELSQNIENEVFELGQTEEIQGTKIIFTKFFLLNYYFEKDQILYLKLNKNSHSISFNISLGKVVGSKGQILSFPIDSLNPNHGSFILKAQVLHEDNYEASIKVFLYSRDKSTKINPYFYLKRDSDENSRTNAYKSEVMENQLSHFYDFSLITIKTLYLNNNSINRPFIIEFHDNLTSKIMGYQKVDLDQFSKLNGFKIKFNLLGNVDHNLIINYELVITLVKLEKLYRLVDFLRGGLQISMILGIDFTCSNKQIDDPNSLHYINDNALNPYENAIDGCGKILSKYDYDQKFPVYGFGALVGDEEEVNYCFPINFRENNPFIESFENISKNYRECLKKIKLYGPTCFAPVIRTTLELRKSDDNVYYVLIILTDGQINDMHQTIDVLVEASDLPFSIIIIGIGDGNFTNMIKLDADTNALFNSKGVKAKRDIVQFVEFREFDNNGSKLAMSVFEEIPNQIVEFYRLMKIKPDEPNISDLLKYD